MAKVTYNIINTKDTDKLLNEKGSIIKVFMYLTKCSYGYKNTCCPSQNTISKALNICVKTVQRAVKRLIDLKMISRKRRQRNSNVYTLLNKPTETDLKDNSKIEKVKENIKSKCNTYKNKKIDDFNNFNQRNYKKGKMEDFLNGLCNYEDLLE